MKITTAALTGLSLCLLSFNSFGSDTAINDCIKAIGEAKSGDIIKLESLDLKGKAIYEFELADENGFEWEFMCDGSTGKIIETESEVSSPNAMAFKANVIEDDAVKIALKAYPGVVEEVEYEIEANGESTYEIDIKQKDGTEVKVEVDAASGKIIEEYTEHWEIGIESDERS